MDGEPEAESHDKPPEKQLQANGEPHSGVDGTKPDDGGDNDAIVQLELARKTERSARLTMIATVAVALGTLALAAATFHLASSTVDVASETKRVADRTEDLAKATKGLVKLAREQGTDTKSAIQAASRQASAAEEANKVARDPTVSISVITMGVPSLNAKYTASFSVFDYGRTPAYHVRGQSSVQILSPPLLPPTLQACFSCGDSILFPANGFQGSGLTFDAALDATILDQATIEALKSKSKYLYLVGRVDYLDSDKHARHISICNYLNFEKGISAPCAAGNDAD